jgi:outer membrane immunogenic protein
MRKSFVAGAGTLALGALLAAGSASAADLSVVTPPPEQLPGSAPVINWTGFHIGGHVGYGWGKAAADYAASNLTPAQLSPNGWVGGAQVGYDRQFTSGLVAGIEADISGSGMSASQSSGGNGGGAVTIGQKIDWLSTIRVRLGYAAGRWMPYVTGGVAFGGGTRTEEGNFPGTASRTHTGWTAGLGAEYAINDRWSVRGEYKYVDLGTQNYAIPGPGGQGTNAHLTANVVTVGLNYRF